MKHLLLRRTFLGIILILLSTNAFSQKSFITTIDNEKIIVDDNFFDIQVGNEKIVYKTPNNDNKESIKFKNINSGILGEYNMKRMKIADEKDEQLCFTLAQSKGKKLVGYNKTTAITKFIYYILDANNMVIEKIETYPYPEEKYVKTRKDAEDKIRKHFSDCKDVMDRLAGDNFKRQENVKYSKLMGKMLDQMDAAKAGIVSFFEKPTFSNCDASQQESPSAQLSGEVAISEQKYYYEKISTTATAMGMGSGSRTTDFSFKGTITIKDNSFTFFTKNVETKYKIISYQDGIMKCDDNVNIHTVTIASETGKKGSFAYDTKITLVADKKMGGSTTYYWCKQQ
ncbi:hypothetical protein QWY90_14190 [Flavobacterium paronense]|uniref:DUF4468 domain-containing protein n=1 Tax=Flavobacterium paronense TaxID=1392775 RepID=A0ABV5GEY4_9FLAO|nr:hypothetical protein [Flavobacterium paronense]MDN3678460.1 hypothetical protein [Flavobacterium paronense]